MTPKPGPISSIAGSVLPLKAAEELIATLTDVVSARITADSSGAIGAVHVLVSGETQPKQVVRNIESALMAQLGIRLDHRKISVATTARREPAVMETPVTVLGVQHSVALPVPHLVEGRALYFEDVEIRGSRSKGMTCKVTLRRGDQHYVGEAEGFESERSRVDLAARAALAAIVSTGASEAKGLVYEGAKVISAFDREVVLVGVVARGGRENTMLVGSCAVRDSAETASALAVLSATNRWMDGAKG